MLHSVHISDFGEPMNRVLKISVVILLLFTALLKPHTSSSQDSVMLEIMNRGIQHSERGSYELALLEYQKALDLEPKSGFVNYEMALAHYQMGNKTKALDFAKKAFKEESEHGVQATILMGTVHDELGNYKESVKVFKKGLKKFGDYYLIWFNLGVTANNARDFELAETAFQASIINRLEHVNSHYGLASVMMRQNRRVEALYPLAFFLMLEPNTERSVMAYQDVLRLMSRGVSMNAGDTGNINITLNVAGDNTEDKGYRSADLMMSMLQAARTLERGNDSDTEVFQNSTEQVFKYVADLELEQKDIYTTYYIPLFSALATSEHFDTWSKYVTQQSDASSSEWVRTNQDELAKMFDWLEELNLEPGAMKSAGAESK